MNTEPKHTKGKVRADFRNWESGIPFGIVVPYKGSCIPIADVCGFPPYSAPVKEIIEANAARLVKCWNNHDELVEALEATKILHLGQYAEGTVGHKVFMKIEAALTSLK